MILIFRSLIKAYFHFWHILPIETCKFCTLVLKYNIQNPVHCFYIWKLFTEHALHPAEDSRWNCSPDASVISVTVTVLESSFICSGSAHELPTFWHILTGCQLTLGNLSNILALVFLPVMMTPHINMRLKDRYTFFQVQLPVWMPTGFKCCNHSSCRYTPLIDCCWGGSPAFCFIFVCIVCFLSACSVMEFINLNNHKNYFSMNPYYITTGVFTYFTWLKGFTSLSAVTVCILSLVLFHLSSPAVCEIVTKIIVVVIV